MVCSHKDYDPTDQEARRKVIASAIGSNHAEGLDLDSESLSDLEEFVKGAITLYEVRSRAEARYRPHQSKTPKP